MEALIEQLILEAICEAMKESGLRQGTVVTLNLEENIESEAGHIHIIPAWLWALCNRRICLTPSP